MCDYFVKNGEIEIIVEYDGEQHFRPVCFGGISLKRAKENFKLQKKIDKMDTMFCKENNIVLHRIRYSDDKEKSILNLKERIDKLL